MKNKKKCYKIDLNITKIALAGGVSANSFIRQEFLKLQRRFRHMFKPGNEWMIEDLQKEIDKKWAYLEMMEKITNEN